jgi:uroporphyrin-III C-methyltransferase / precorrin-2 dehydrogenase / sirohydrochlorin ferrochelatase
MIPAADRPYFAAFLDLRGKPGVVVGGGAIAASKVETLLRSGVRVTVVAPDLCARLTELTTLGAIRHEPRRFQPGDVMGAEIAIAATDDAAVNEAVASAARSQRIPVNVADDAARSTFIMPALVDRAPVQIAISTGGASPLLARKLRAIIETAVPFAFGRLAALAARFREASKRKIQNSAARRRFWKGVIDGPVADLVFAGREDEAVRMLERDLGSGGGSTGAEGMVYLVDASTGDPELLTLRALRVLQTADVVLYDASVPQVIIDLARREAERIRANNGSEELALRLAREGKRVVWLGDRVGVRTEALASQRIVVEVVPGVSEVPETRSV